jgi:hypothetical protein
MPLIHKLLILEEAMLVSMAGNPNFTREFPFLDQIKGNSSSNPDCSKCNNDAQKRVALVSGVKQAIVSMGAEKKARLKAMLSTEQVRVRVNDGGKILEYTF